MSSEVKLNTPSYSHISKCYTNSVYEPSEDTFLLIDALEKDLEAIEKQRPLIALEVGSGSGAVISSLASYFNKGTYFIGTDINASAARATLQTASVNGVTVDSVVTDLVIGLLPRINGKVDLLLFNPPYVVTPHAEVGKRDLSSAWAGGELGREVVDRLLPLVNRLLSPTGVFYLVAIKENKPVWQNQPRGLGKTNGEKQKFMNELSISLQSNDSAERM